ncbi:MAG: ABC transporter permease [Caulobacterales bacterium]|nr:ABC transporter permease [Caulobacterales bacterium]
MSDATLLPPPRPAPLLPASTASDRPLLLAVATIIALACASAIAARATWSASVSWTSELRGAMTVQVNPAPGENGAAVAAGAANALADLDGVAAVRPLRPDEVAALIAPWLGADALPDDTPLPGLVDVRLDPLAPASAGHIAAALEVAGIDGLVDDHGAWSRELERAVASVRALALAVLALLLAAAAAVTAFATRASLAARRDVVEVLHLVGARDGFIADEFTRRFAIIGLQAGLLGAALAVLTAYLFQTLSAGESDLFLPHFQLAWIDAAIVAATPISAGAVAGFTAQRTVIGALRGLH